MAGFEVSIYGRFWVSTEALPRLPIQNVMEFFVFPTPLIAEYAHYADFHWRELVERRRPGRAPSGAVRGGIRLQERPHS